MPSKKRSNSKDQSIEYKFAKDEKVLVLPAKHGEDIYEAKVLDRKGDKSKQPQYKIHYKGWNKRWDEWVDQRRLLKINASNVQIMSEKNSQNKQLQQQKKQQLKQQQQEESQHDEYHSSKHSKSPSPSRKRKLHHSNNSNNSKKRKLNVNDNDDDVEDVNDNENEDDHDEENENNSDHDNKVNENDDMNHGDGMDVSSNGIPLEIKLPTKLKRKLITDWENITKKNMLIDLPRSNAQRISQILSDFEEFAIKTGQDRNLVIEISRGIKDYFNQALQVTLLYKLERKQHESVIHKHPQLSMDQIYGVEHLCRLFVKLPQLLSPNDLDSDTRQILTAQIDCIIKFIIKNESKYFCTNYIQSS